MRVLSVDVFLPREVVWRGKSVTTGIYKEPVEGRVPRSARSTSTAIGRPTYASTSGVGQSGLRLPIPGLQAVVA